MVCVWGQVAFRLTFVARHGRTQVLVYQHDNVVIKNSLRSKKIHAMLPTFTISRGVLLKRDILGRWGFVRGSAVSHGAHFDGLMSGLCCAVLCGLVGRWRGKQRLVSGRTGELLGFLSLTLLDNWGHLLCARICWTWGVAFSCHSAWDPLSEILKE